MTYEWKVSPGLQKALDKTMKLFEFSTPLHYELAMRSEFVSASIPLFCKRDSNAAHQLLKNYLERARDFCYDKRWDFPPIRESLTNLYLKLGGECEKKSRKDAKT